MTLKNKNKNITGYMLTIYKTPDFQVEKRVNEPQNMGQSTLRKNPRPFIFKLSRYISLLFFLIATHLTVSSFREFSV